MVACERHITAMSFQSRNETLCRVIPDLDSSIVGSCEEIWLVGLRVVINVVHTFGLVCFEGKSCCRRTQTPYLDSPVQTCRGERVGVLGIYRKTHYIVAVTFEHLNALPSLLPVPELYRHVIRSSQYEGLCGMDDDCTNVIRMSFEGGNLFGGVVVVDSQLEVVRAAHYPVLARNEATCSDWHVCKLEGLDDGLYQSVTRTVSFGIV